MPDSSENPHIIADQIFYFGGLRADPSRNVLHNGTESFHLEPRIMSVLCALASHAGEVVTRDALIESIWNVEYGADESLTRAISLLRKTFREAGEPDGHIETIPKSGYRLARKVSYENAATPPVSGDEHSASQALPPQSIAVNSPAYLSVRKTVVTILVLISLAVLSVTGLNALDRPGLDAPVGTDLATGEGRSVAILSFTDMSASQDQEHFTDGITEEIFTALAEISNLRIAARNSSFAYKGKPTDMRTIGQDLSVSHIIDGSIRTEGEKIRVTAQLINTSDGLHVWTKSYDGLQHDMFGLQERVSQDIVSELRIALSIGLEDVIPLELNIPRGQSKLITTE